jgi:hypothetical protein
MKHEKLLLPTIFCQQELLIHLDPLIKSKVVYSSTEAIITVSLKFCGSTISEIPPISFFNKLHLLLRQLFFSKDNQQLLNQFVDIKLLHLLNITFIILTI